MQALQYLAADDLPITDRIGSGTASHRYTSWVEDDLAAPEAGPGVAENWIPDTNNARNGVRIGNHCQISQKALSVTQRARQVDTIGYADELAYQIMRRQSELRRDVEATLLSNQGSVEPATESDPTQTAGLGAFITQGDRVGTGGGFASGLVADYVVGVGRALSFSGVMDIVQAIWEKGGEPSMLTSVPSVTRKFVEYCIANDQQIVDMTNEVGSSGAQANRLVKTLLTEWGFAIEILPNRQQQLDTDLAAAFLLDPAFLEIGYLQGYQTEEMGRRGLPHERFMTVDWQTRCLNRNAHGVFHDIDPTLAVED